MDSVIDIFGGEVVENPFDVGRRYLKEIREDNMKKIFKVKTNIPATIKFVDYETGKKVEGDYGPQFMYTVEAEGEKQVFYTSEHLNDLIIKAIGENVKDKTVNILKEEEAIEGKRKTRWSVIDPQADDIPGESDIVKADKAIQNEFKELKGEDLSKEALLKTFGDVYKICLNSAKAICKETSLGEDNVREVATTLFIAMTRR